MVSALYLSFVWVLLFSFSPPAFAVGGQVERPRLLMSSVSQTEGMSRAELLEGPSEISLAAPAQPLPPLPAFKGDAQQPSLGASVAQSANACQSDLAADVKVREYNVDWSTWLSKVADRWFFMLDNCERESQMRFVTIRPALFQFTCYNNGAISNVTLKQSSGNRLYDRMQMVALMQSMPVPPFPLGTHRQYIVLVQGWESHYRKPGESDYIPGSFGRGFLTEKVKEWVQVR